MQEGEAVERGALLYTLDLDTTTKDGSTQQQIINAQTAAREMLTQEIDRKTRMSEETRKQLQQKIENLKVQIDQLGGQITMHQGFFKTINKEYNLFLGLVERRQASLNEMNSRQQAWMQSQSKLQELESSKLRLTGELNEAQYQLATIAISTADEIDALKTRILEIDEKLVNSKARRSIEIHAPEAGVVTAIVAHPGQMVSTGAPMLKIVPQHASMHAELLAPSSAIGFIVRRARTAAIQRLPLSEVRRVLGHSGEHLAGRPETGRGGEPAGATDGPHAANQAYRPILSRHRQSR